MCANGQGRGRASQTQVLPNSNRSSTIPRLLLQAINASRTYIAVVNDGSRGAQSFHIYVNPVGAVGGVILNDVWDQAKPDLFHRTVYTPVFAGDAIWLREFEVAFPVNPSRAEDSLSNFLR